MTNYIVEDGLNLWDLISDTESNNTSNKTSKYNYDSCCLLSGEKLIQNFVTLPCKHKFNYTTLVEELKILHAPTQYCKQKIPLNSLICPYCRQITTGLLLNIEHEIGVSNVQYVTTNKISIAIPHYQCQYIIKTGKAKGTNCTSKHAYYNDTFTLCHKHHKSNNLTKDVINKCPNLSRCSRAELIAFLDSRGISTSGTKPTLAIRVYEILGTDSPSLLKAVTLEK